MGDFAPLRLRKRLGIPGTSKTRRDSRTVAIGTVRVSIKQFLNLLQQVRRRDRDFLGCVLVSIGRQDQVG